MIRKQDILKPAKAHPDAYFHIFTNTTLIDEKFCQDVVDCGNISFALPLKETGCREHNSSDRLKKMPVLPVRLSTEISGKTVYMRSLLLQDSSFFIICIQPRDALKGIYKHAKNHIH